MPIKTKKVASFKDEALNEQTGHIISILCTQDGFSFTLYDRQHNKFLALEAYNFEYQNRDIELHAIDNHIYTLLKVLIEESDFISRFNKHQGYLTFVPEQCTWVPLSLFDDQKIEEYIMLNFGQKKEKVFFEINQHIEAVCIYTVNQMLLDGLDLIFPKVEKHPLQNVLVSQFFQVIKTIQYQTVLFCFSTNSHVFIQVFQKNILIFENSFFYQNKQDLAFYILNVYDKLSLHTENVPLIFSGEFTLNSEIVSFLKKYIINVSPLQTNKAFAYSYLFNNIEMHRFYHIFNTIPCVLLAEFGKAEE